MANGDEMEPGTFKDRLLMEGNPHQLLEGVILAAYAIEADLGYVFIRWAYHDAFERPDVGRAEEARAAGYIGENILGSGFNLELHIHVSAGRYMCGEETGAAQRARGQAGRRRGPSRRSRRWSGLCGKPTIVQNIETLCNVPHIVANGADWFRDLGLTEDAGTKLYGVSGKVKRPGHLRAAHGHPDPRDHRGARRRHAGRLDVARVSCPEARRPPSSSKSTSTCRWTSATIEKAGSRLGTGTMIVLDDRTCPVGMLHNLEHFFAQETCGWCTPCREGLPWVEKTLERHREGRRSRAKTWRFSTTTAGCSGPGTPSARWRPERWSRWQSALKYFREDFERTSANGDARGDRSTLGV